MTRELLTLFALTCLFSGKANAVDNSSVAGPKIDAMDWQGAETVCAAWQEGDTAENAQRAGLVWIGLPAAVKPFGMRAYVSVDGMMRPLRQIAYSHAGGDLAVHYRTLGDRPYDVRLELSGLEPGGIKGDHLAGKLVVSRFGVFTEIKLTGSCGQQAR